MSSLPNLMSSISQRTRSTSESCDARRKLWREALGAPLEDFLSRQGKRIRADLIGIAFRTAGGKGEAPSEIVEFVELLHAGSLIIDDIQDNSRNRRRQETIHLKYGVPLAINTGNWLYFAALERLAEVDLPPAKAMTIMNKSLRVIKHCHSGQALDLTATFNELPPHAIPQTVEQISQLKTGALTALAAWLGGMLGGGSDEVCENLSNFGLQLGIGLQMQNDFVELQKAAFSRCNSDDFRNRRITWPWAWLANTVSATEVQRLARLACEQIPEVQDCAQQILERIEIVAVNEINSKLEGSISELNTIDLDHRIRKQLDQIVATLELRYV